MQRFKFCFWVLFALIPWWTSSLKAQFITDFSLEAAVVDADAVAVGRIAELKFKADIENTSWHEYQITLTPKDVLKGELRDSTKVLVTLDDALKKSIEAAMKQGETLLFMLGKQENTWYTDWLSTGRIYACSGRRVRYLSDFTSKNESFESCVNDIKRFLEYNREDPAKGNAAFWFGSHRRTMLPNNERLQDYCLRYLNNSLTNQELETIGLAHIPDSKNDRAHYRNKAKLVATSAIANLSLAPNKKKVRLLQHLLQSTPHEWTDVSIVHKGNEIEVVRRYSIHASIIHSLKAMGVDADEIPEQAEQKTIWKRSIDRGEVGFFEQLQSHQYALFYWDTIDPEHPPQRQIRTKKIKLRDLEEIPDLSAFEKLESLELVNVSRVDLSRLSDLKQLKHLNLTGLDIEDFQPIAKLKNLESVNLSHTDLGDLSPLANLSNLRSLNICLTKVTDVTPLQNLKHLEWLNVFGNKEIDLGPLSAMKNLKIQGR